MLRRLPTPEMALALGAAVESLLVFLLLVLHLGWWPAYLAVGLAPLAALPFLRRTGIDPDPLPQQAEDAASRIFAFVDDLFFQAKIQETARKLNVKVEFVKSEKDLLDRVKENGEETPSLIIFDMNNVNAKPLTLIPKLKSKMKKASIIGFLSHVQGDLKQKAHEVGCDMVLPVRHFRRTCHNCCAVTAHPKRKRPSSGE